MKTSPMRTVMQTEQHGDPWPSQRSVSCSASHTEVKLSTSHTSCKNIMLPIEGGVCKWGSREGEPQETWLLIGCFTGIYPITVNIHWLWQVGDRRLKLLQANAAGYDSCVAGSLHFDIAGFLVVTERACELGVQVTCHFFLGGWLSLWLPAPHF